MIYSSEIAYKMFHFRIDTCINKELYRTYERTVAQDLTHEHMNYYPFTRQVGHAQIIKERVYNKKILIITIGR